MFSLPTRRISIPVLKYAAIYFSSIACVLILLVLLGHQLDRQFEKQRWQTVQMNTVARITSEASRYFYESLSDLLLLADNGELFSGDEKSNAELERLFIRFARITRSYHQLRYINNNGQEVVRVNFDGEKPSRVPVAQLQNKEHRHYFQKTIKLNKNQVYVSKLDLNIEHHQIERPYRPVIRFAIPVFDNEGNKSGILILNYLGEKLLKQFEVNNRSNEGHLYLLNDDGYYLYSDTPEQTWGFQIKGRPRFQENFSEWNAISQNRTGQLVSSHGLLTYAAVDLFENVDQEWVKHNTPMYSVSVKSEEGPWRVVSVLPNSSLYAGPNKRLNLAFIVLAIILLLILPVTVVMGQSRERENELVKKQKIYVQVVEQINDLIYITDSKGMIRYANPAVERHTGYAISELIGKTPKIFSSGKQSDSFYQRLWDTVKTGEIFEGYFVNRCKDGKLFYEHKTISPLRDSSGRITQFVSTGRDITGTRNLREKDMVATSELARSLLHHFGNLLQGIIGLAQIMLANGEAHHVAALNEYLSALLDTGKKAEKLLTDIRSITVIDHDKLPVIDLRLLLKEVVATTTGGLPEGIIFSTCNLEKIANIRGHYSLLRTALLALLNNARDAVGESGSIVIGVDRIFPIKTTCVTCGEPLNGEYLQIYVSDSGKGIPSESRERIWDPFYTTKESGHLVAVTPGLGLTAVRSIIHSHRGHLLLDSNNNGITIRLLFPFEQSGSSFSQQQDELEITFG